MLCRPSIKSHPHLFHRNCFIRDKAKQCPHCKTQEKPIAIQLRLQMDRMPVSLLTSVSKMSFSAKGELFLEHRASLKLPAQFFFFNYCPRLWRVAIHCDMFCDFSEFFGQPHIFAQSVQFFMRDPNTTLFACTVLQGRLKFNGKISSPFQALLLTAVVAAVTAMTSVVGWAAGR